MCKQEEGEKGGFKLFQRRRQIWMRVAKEQRRTCCSACWWPLNANWLLTTFIIIIITDCWFLHSLSLSFLLSTSRWTNKLTDCKWALRSVLRRKNSRHNRQQLQNWWWWSLCSFAKDNTATVEHCLWESMCFNPISSGLSPPPPH